MYSLHVEIFFFYNIMHLYMHLTESSNGKTTTPSTTYKCDSGISPNNPERDTLYWNEQITIVNTPLQHADRCDTIWLCMPKPCRPSSMKKLLQYLRLLMLSISPHFVCVK